MQSIQLTQPKGYKVKNMIFSRAENNTIPTKGGAPIQYKRIQIETKYSDGTQGPIILPTANNNGKGIFSFGVQQNKDSTTGRLTGFTMPLCLWSKGGATEEELTFIDTINDIVEHVKDYLVKNRDEIEQFDLEKSDLKRLNPLYYKKSGGKRVEGIGPVLYSKLLCNRSNEIKTMFTNSATNSPLDPHTLQSKYCYVEGAVKVESIFIGNSISLQVKLYEAIVTPLAGAMKSLLGSSNTKKPLESKPLESKPLESDSGSESESGSDSVKSQSPSPPKKVVKRRVVKRKPKA